MLLRSTQLQKELFEAKNALLESQIKMLRHQVDPHFLFNNLNTLSYLIPAKNKAAQQYIQHLSELYRQVLSNTGKDVVTLKEELELANRYVYLIKERYGNIYNFIITIKTAASADYMIPPFILQELFINAIKHNEASSLEPLNIEVWVEGEYMSITNPVRPKQSQLPAGTQTGISNLIARMKIFTDIPVEIVHTTDLFSVKLPLLKIAAA